MSTTDTTPINVERLSLNADDVLVFSIDSRLSAEQRNRIQEIAVRSIGGVRGWHGKVLVLDHGMRLKVLSPQRPVTVQRLAEIAKRLGWHEDWWMEGNGGELLRLTRAIEQELGIGDSQTDDAGPAGGRDAQVGALEETEA